ncbi:MAG: dTDP-4-dehydrorhamnose reductase [Minwuia sp.]|uniref:dTDP-4-dehydrorhamnose reductase n=1 Tax=Minwuia sp. TaxID=2493630 RepID=UPI003A89978A
MVLLVVGSDGQVGSSLRWRAMARRQSVIGLNRGQLDITERSAVIDTVAHIRPDAVINCAAFTDVDGAEKNETAAMQVNALGAAHLAQACQRTGAPLIHLSTDYVFDGNKVAPWREDDPVNPVSAYGRSKEAGERAIRDAWGKHVILRTAWVFGAIGPNFVKTMLRLAGQGQKTVRVVNDQRGSPTPADAIAEACLDIVERASRADITPWGTYHYCGSPTVTWHEFASAILKDRPIEVQACTSAEFERPAQRPANSVLDCTRIRKAFGIEQPDWQDYLPELIEAFGKTVEDGKEKA